MARIVVGIDGSPESQKALIFAVNEAHVRGEQLRAISVWCGRGSRDGQDTDRANEAQAAGRSALDIVLAEAAVPATELLVCEGDPAQVLIEESRGAAMLVVGSRGRGRLAGALLARSAGTAPHMRIARWPSSAEAPGGKLPRRWIRVSRASSSGSR